MRRRAFSGCCPRPLASDLARAVDEGSKLPNDVLAPLKASLVGETLVDEIVGYLDPFMDCATLGADRFEMGVVPALPIIEILLRSCQHKA